MLAAEIMQSKWKEEWPESSIENSDILIAGGAWARSMSTEHDKCIFDESFAEDFSSFHPITSYSN